MSERSEQIVPGLWSLPVAIPSKGLRVVYSYAFQHDGGLVLVDLGWGNHASLASLESGLAKLGASVRDIRGVLFTHAHPDHYGLAGAVKQQSGAWLAIHPAEMTFLDGNRRRPGFLRELSAEVAMELGDAGNLIRREPELPVVSPDRMISDGDLIEFGTWRLAAVHTPGHAPGHLCFTVESASVVLLGDHVLSRTTPNVSYWPWSDGDPLGDYLDSLRKIAGMSKGVIGLPGHEDRIIDVPARAEAIIAHHESQFADVTDLVVGGHQTIGAVAQRMQWSRRWSDLGQLDQVMALGEAHAHLRALERRGQLRRIAGTPRRFAPA